MFNRVYFPLIALFWAVMNVLLWRAEFGGGKELNSSVPPEVVWQKILTAPDDSTLEISRNGKKTGYCRWGVNAGESLAVSRVLREDLLPDGIPDRVRHNMIELDGNLISGEPPARVRFNLRLDLSTNHIWRELSLRLASRPEVWLIHSSAAEETLDLKYEDDTSQWKRTFTFGELRNPRKLLEEFVGPLPLAFMGPAIGLEQQQKKLSIGLRWEAQNDRLKIGHSETRVYRLQAQLLDSYKVVVIVSRVGEIMRVELPGGWLLVNEALTSL